MQSEKPKIKLTKYNSKQFSKLSTPQNEKIKPPLIQTAFLSKKSQNPIIKSSRNRQSSSISKKNDSLQELSYNKEERKERKALNFTVINDDLGKVEEDKYEKEELEAINPIEMANKFYQDNGLIIEEFNMNTQELLKQESESVKQTIRSLTKLQGYQQPSAFKSISNNNYKIKLHQKLKTLQFQSRDVGQQIDDFKKWFAESKGAMNLIVSRIVQKESELQKVHDQKMNELNLKEKELAEKQAALKRQEDDLAAKLKEYKEKLHMQIQIPVEAQRLELPKDFKNIIPPIKPPNFEKQPMEVQQCYHNAVICNTFVKPPPIKEEIQNTNAAVQNSGIHKLMSCILNQVGAKYVISGNEEKSNLKTINMLASEQSNLACFSATFLNHNLIKSALEFQMEIKEALSECFKKSIHEISIVNQFPRNNDIIVNLVIDKVFKQDDNVPEIAYEALQILRQRFQKNISLMPVKMFEFFYLGEKDFDSAGDIKFKSQNGLVFKRGGYDYNQPCNLYRRVGINVSGKFDNGCNLWLQTDADGKGKEWAVGFHGLRHDVRSAVKGIIQNGFEVKREQAFRGDIDIGRNKQNFVDQERCGNGIYLAPHVDICMGKNFGQLSYCRPVKFNDYY